MSVPLIILLLSVAVTKGQDDCVGPIPASVTEVDCSDKNITAVPILPAEAVEV